MNSKRIKTLLVSSSLSGGGAERFVSTALEHLDRARFEPHLCLLRNQTGYEISEDVAVVKIGGAGCDDRPLASVARTRPWIVWQTIRRLRYCIESLRPDVVLSNIDQVNCVTASALRSIQHRPVWIARVGNNPRHEVKWLNAWRHWSYRQADAIVANSSGLAEGVRKLYDLPHDRVHCIGNPVDFDQILRESSSTQEPIPDERRPVIVFAGRLTRQKRTDILIDAFDRISRKLPAHLVICGDGPLRHVVRRDITVRGLQGSVQMLGFCDNPYAWMRRADLFVMTSDHEGLPNALIEAQGLGTPAVSTDCDYGPSEIIDHGNTGLSVSPGDASGIAHAMEELLRDPARIKLMGTASAERSRRMYDVKPLIQAWQSLLVDCHARQTTCSMPALRAA